MAERTKKVAQPFDPLFLDERQVAERLGLSIDEWRATAVVLERSGLPRVDDLFGRRYWPAVKAYFDRRHGLGQSLSAAVADGRENWDEERGRRRHRSGARPAHHRA